MQMSDFFETDQDEHRFNGLTYVDYFNLYPNLWFTPTLAHLTTISEITVLNTSNASEGWQIAVNFCNLDFLLDTHFHGTSTMFCVERNVSDKTAMLAFLGCFLPTIRDDWPMPAKTTTKNPT